jgi:TatD DNase family protein
VLQRAQGAGVSAIVNICTDKPTLERGLELAQRYPWVYTVASTTPHDIEKEGEALFPLMAHHAKAGNLVAVGETGLDYYYKHSDPQLQRYFLRRYLHLALECELPVVIHCREAFVDLFEMLDVEYITGGRHAPGVLHCFTGTVNEAEEVFKRDWYLSLSGIVTFKKSEILREVAKMAPLNRLLVETDAPYLAPQSRRGYQNEPSYIKETVMTIASVKNIPVEEVMAATTANACHLFGLEIL